MGEGWYLLSACSEMPVEAASEMMATSFSPFMKEFFSAMLMSFMASCSGSTLSRKAVHMQSIAKVCCPHGLL